MNLEQEKVYIWLSLFNFLSLKKQKQLLNLYETPTMLWQKFNVQSSELKALLSDSDLTQMQFSHDDNIIKNFVKNCEEQGITLVTQGSKQYSKLLLETEFPPLVLYCKGNIALLNSPSVSIVGTRKPTRYGKDATAMFAGGLARAGLTVVSGLADGIDTQAHRSTLENKGNTIAVLGSGLNEIYPASNLGLAKEIEKNGLLVSEYKPNEKPQTYYFPSRNRIIAGLSSGVLITEASEKSGSMHTKNYALDYNRNLFVLPGRITDKLSMGCNKIIKNLQASMVLEPQDILTTYGLTDKGVPVHQVQLDLNDEIVLSCIPTDTEIHYEQLLAKTKLEAKVLNTILIRLEMKGMIKKQSGNFYYI